MPSGRLQPRLACNATSWIVTARSGLPATEKRPWSRTTSSGAASSICAASFLAFSTTFMVAL